MPLILALPLVSSSSYIAIWIAHYYPDLSLSLVFIDLRPLSYLGIQATSASVEGQNPSLCTLQQNMCYGLCFVFGIVVRLHLPCEGCCLSSWNSFLRDSWLPLAIMGMFDLGPVSISFGRFWSSFLAWAHITCWYDLCLWVSLQSPYCLISLWYQDLI